VRTHAARCTISLISLFLTLGAAAAAPAPLGINIDAQSVTVSNVTPGGSVVLFSCSRVPRARSIAVRPDALVLRDDRHAGVVRATPAGGVPLRSVFIAVDETSGEYVVGGAPGFPLISNPISTDVLRKDANGEIASMFVDTPRLVLLLVRPGVGAWQLKSFDGGPLDHDGAANGHQQLAFEDAQTLDGKDKAPKNLKADDVVVAIEPGHLDVSIVRVVK